MKLPGDGRGRESSGFAVQGQISTERSVAVARGRNDHRRWIKKRLLGIIDGFKIATNLGFTN